MQYNRKHLIGLLLPTALTCVLAYQSGYANTLPLPLGKLIDTAEVPCPTGAAVGAICKHTTVTDCKDTNGNPLLDEGVTIAITQGAPTNSKSHKGTIVLHSGGAATSFFNNDGFADYYVSQGYNVVQLAWDPGPNNQGWNTDSSGILAHACRPSTVFNELYKDPRAHVKHTAFCGQGISGGAAVLGFAVEHYGNTVHKHERETQQYLFDYVLLASGSPAARFDVGCAPLQTYNDAPITNCGIVSNAVSPPPLYSFPAGAGNPVDTWEGTSTCGTPNPPQTDIDRWARDSNISTGPLAHPGVFKYKDTNVSFYFCGSPQNNQSLGLSWFLTQVTEPRNGAPLAPVNCFTQCTGESVWNDPKAVTQTEDDMAEFCVFNHRHDHDQD